MYLIFPVDLQAFPFGFTDRELKIKFLKMQVTVVIHPTAVGLTACLHHEQLMATISLL